MIDVARTYLVDREFRLLNSRKNPVDNDNTSPIRRNTATSNALNNQVPGTAQYDPFKRNDSKRKSLSKSISSIFGRRGSSTVNNNQNNNNNSNNNVINNSKFLFFFIFKFIF